MPKRKVILEDWGNILYQKAWDRQKEVQKGLIDYKRNPDSKALAHHRLIFCEHNPIYTLGKSGKEEHLLISNEERNQKNIEFLKINRGGDITFHGPGQIVGYPIFDLDDFYTDIHKYVRMIEQVIIDTLQEYNIRAERRKGFTGVWIADEKSERKICAIGIHMSRWVSMHGFAFNINTDLNYFNHIVPCGIQEANKEVTSLSKELNRSIDVNEVKSKIAVHFQRLFEFEWLDNADKNVLLDAK